MRFYITKSGDTLDTLVAQYYQLPLMQDTQGAAPEEITELMQKVGEEIKRTPGNEGIRSGKLRPGQWIFLPTVNGIEPFDSGNEFWQHTRSFLGYAVLLTVVCWLIAFCLEPVYQWLSIYFPLTTAGPLGVFIGQTIVSRPVTVLSMLQLFVLGETALFTIWFFSLPGRTAIHSGLVYLVTWLLGSVFILLFANSILSFLLPRSAVASALIDWVDIFVTWTTLVAIAYVLMGDNTTTYRSHIKEHKSIYISFLLTILYTGLLLNFTHDYIHLRIGGLLAPRQELTAQLENTVAALARVHNLTLTLERDLKAGIVSPEQEAANSTAGGCSLASLDRPPFYRAVAIAGSASLQPAAIDSTSPATFITQPKLGPICASLTAAASANHDALALYDQVRADEANLVGQIVIAKAATGPTVRFLGTNQVPNTNQPGTSVAWTKITAAESLTHTIAVATTLHKLEKAFKDAAPTTEADATQTSAPRDSTALTAIVSNELLPQVEIAHAASVRAVAAVLGVKNDSGPIFGGTASLLVLFVLFPWFLLLLFFLRKRTNLSAGIVNDLIRLAPNHALLNRVLGLMDIKEGGENGNLTMRGTDKEQVNQQVELVHAIQLLPTTPGNPIIVSETRKGVLAFDIVKRAIADKAFSDLEYILAITLLSAAFAIGWYFVLFPKTSIGLSLLILENSGIIGFATYIVSNFTPITAGFVGAYMWSTYVLLRRYFNGDLYPSAYLGAVQRTIMVFILTLIIMVLGNVIYEGGETALPATFWSALLGLSFFIGIFPEVGFTFLRDVVNRIFKSTFPSLAERAPLTELDGLNYFIVGRLVEEDVENIQSLATAKIEDLVVSTYFPGKRIVDWIDQAVLYLHCGRNGEWFQPLRSVGIRNATDLLDALGDDIVGTAPAKTQKGVDETCLQILVDAVRTGQVADEKPLTREILLEIYDSIWPDPNMEHLLTWQRGKILERE